MSKDNFYKPDGGEAVDASTPDLSELQLQEIGRRREAWIEDVASAFAANHKVLEMYRVKPADSEKFKQRFKSNMASKLSQKEGDLSKLFGANAITVESAVITLQQIEGQEPGLRIFVSERKFKEVIIPQLRNDTLIFQAGQLYTIDEYKEAKNIAPTIPLREVGARTRGERDDTSSPPPPPGTPPADALDAPAFTKRFSQRSGGFAKEIAAQEAMGHQY